MRSSIRNLIIVAVCAAVLGGALLALKLTGNDEAASSGVSSTESIELVSKKSEDVVSMSVVNQKGNYTLVPVPPAPASSSASSGASSASVTSAPTYTVEGLSGLPINTSATDSVVRNGFSLVASKNLGVVSSLDDYGLKDPQAAVKVSFKDGSSFNYKIGKASATNSTAYYMCGMDSDNVYVVTIDDGLLEDERYFVSKEILAITNPNGQSSQNGQSAQNEFTKIAFSGANYPKPVVLSVQGDALKIVEPAVYEADADTLPKVENALASLTADTVEAVNPDAAALKKYGFDNPTAVASFTVNGKSYTLRAGGASGDNYYVMLDGVDVVYTAPKSGVDPWASEGLLGLRSKLIFLPNITTVKTMRVTAGGKENVLNVARTKDEKQSTKDKPVYTYQLTGNDGKTLDYENNYKHFYQHVIGISILEDTQEKPDTASVLTVRYEYFDKAAADTLEFLKSGDRRYTAVLNGRVYGIVTQDDIDTVTEQIERLESGQTVSDPL